jgi:hypothetical protein
MDKELEKAIKIIDGLISAIQVMPCWWCEFVGMEFSKEILEFLMKHDPENRFELMEDEDE